MHHIYTTNSIICTTTTPIDPDIATVVYTDVRADNVIVFSTIIEKGSCVG